MIATYPATYRDEHGEETGTIETDGKHLSVMIRNVRFEGTAFDGLEPMSEEDDLKQGMFTLAYGSLSDCAIEFEMPMPILASGETIMGILHVNLRLGKPRVDGGIDHEDIALRLSFGQFTISSPGKYGWFDDELRILQSAMPSGYFLKCCHNCAFSEYYPAGHGMFGDLACFRDNKVEFLAVRNKGDLFRVWDTRTEFVQETYLCPEFQPKRHLSNPKE